MILSCRSRHSARVLARSAQSLPRMFSSSMHEASNTNFKVNEKNVLRFANQTVFAGTDALHQLAEALAKTSKKPLIVTDPGVVQAGALKEVEAVLAKHGLTTVVYKGCKPNPGISDVQAIAQTFLDNGCDECVGVGGGGPIDAAKAGMAVVAQTRLSSSFSINKDTPQFITTTCRSFGKHVTKEFATVVPRISAVPTTAGTGSEGGKSSVITDVDGVKVVFGHASLMPVYASLVPQLTASMPKTLTLATAVDAMFHCLEPLFCPTDIMIERDGMTRDEITYCDKFGEQGLKLIAKHLPAVLSDPQNLEARLFLQIAALYGAKAFRKGDLGGVHATAHALGAKYHIHHGNAVGRMAVHVLRYNENHPDLENEHAAKADVVRKIFGGKDTMHESVYQFLEHCGVTQHISDLVEWQEDIAALADLAARDGCQTNPVPLNQQDYVKIFENAASSS